MSNDRSGFTGIDGQRAAKDINSYYEEAYSLLSDYISNFRLFADFLEKKWASQTAFYYSKTLTSEINSILHEYYNELMHIVHGAEDAANILLESNGEEKLHFDLANTVWADSTGNHGEGHGIPHDIDFQCFQNLDGLVGMDTAGVKVELQNYKTKVSSIIASFDSLPNGISFYDPEDKLVDTYDRNLSAFKQKFQNFFDDFVLNMSNYVETEKDNIELAKVQAEQAMA